VAESGNQAAGIDIEKGLGLLVGVDFNVLIRNLLVFE
jgi:hypothetical protein